MVKIILIIIFASFCFSCKPKIPYTDDMKLELKNMHVKDQNAQKYDLKKVNRKEYSDSMEIEFNKVCKKNLIVVKKYFNENGFPGIKENGDATAPLCEVSRLRHTC